MDYIICIENAIGQGAKKDFLPMQQDGVCQTYADSSALAVSTGFTPLCRQALTEPCCGSRSFIGSDLQMIIAFY